MPSKGTTRRAIRISDDLWTSALTLARSRNKNLSDIIRAALQAYLSRRGR